MRWRRRVRYWRQLLVEARSILAIGVLVAAASAAVAFGLEHGYGPEGDVWGSSSSADPGVICRRHGEGAIVCSPAPEGVRHYREQRKTAGDAGALAP